MSFQTRQTFIHLRNTIKIFFMKSESLDSKGPTTIKAQKRSKNIVIMVCDISGSNRNVMKLRELSL